MPPKSNNEKKAEALAAGRKPKLTKQQARSRAREQAPQRKLCMIRSRRRVRRLVPGLTRAAQENAGKSPSAKKAEQKAARAAKADANGTVRK